MGTRRGFLAVLAVMGFAAPTLLFGQQRPPAIRVGFLGAESASVGRDRLDALRSGLRELGYVYAIIGSAGPIDFYERVVGAIVIPDSEPGIYVDLLKS